jgi:glycerophosphoryl diester phosphodiesterase
MRVYGHRGSPRTHRENSAAGVAAAFAQGAYGVEIDVRRTPEDRLVCSHDPLSGAPVDPLADVLEAARGRVICEVKNNPGEPDFDAPAEATAHLLVPAVRGRDVTVSSFDWFAIEVARDAGLRTGFLTMPGITLDASVAYVTDAGHDECHPHWVAVLEDPGAVERAHDAGVEVVCWTVDDREVVLRLREAGVDAVITNDVALVRDALDDD